MHCNGNTEYPEPKKVEAVTKFPLPTTHRELGGWYGLCNQLNHYVPGLAGKQAEFSKLLKKNVQFTVTPRKEAEYGSANKAMGNSILLNSLMSPRGRW